jgi:hypothetical protein
VKSAPGVKPAVNLKDPSRAQGPLARKPLTCDDRVS